MKDTRTLKITAIMAAAVMLITGIAACNNGPEDTVWTGDIAFETNESGEIVAVAVLETDANGVPIETSMIDATIQTETSVIKIQNDDGTIETSVVTNYNVETSGGSVSGTVPGTIGSTNGPTVVKPSTVTSTNGTTATIPTPKPTTGTSGTTSTSQTSGTSATTKPTDTPKPTEASGTTATTAATPTATEAPKPTETSGTTSTQATNTPTPTTAPTEAVADPTSTPEPTATPTEVPVETTPEPTATPTPEPTQDPATVVDYTYTVDVWVKAFGTDDLGVPNGTLLASGSCTVTVYMDGHSDKTSQVDDKTEELIDEALDVLRNTYGIENPKVTMISNGCG